MMDTRALIRRLLPKDGGFTVHVQTGQEPQHGYAASTHPDRAEKLHIDALDVNVLNGFIARNLDVLTQPGAYLGAWHDPDNDDVWLDISTVTSGQAEAVEIGLKAHQLAIFDILHGKSIPI